MEVQRADEHAQQLVAKHRARHEAARAELDMIFAYFAPPGAMLRRIGGSAGAAGRGSSSPPSRTTMRPSPPLATATAGCFAATSRCTNISRPSCTPSSRSSTTSSTSARRTSTTEALHRSRDHAPDQGRRLRRRDARLFRARARPTASGSRPSVHKRRANPWRRLKWALSRFLVNVMDYTRHAAAELRPDASALARPCTPRTGSPAAR